MANRLSVDELNVYDKVNSKVTKAIPYRTYFGEMDLDDEEKEKRISLAEALEKVFLFLFVVLAVEEALGNQADVEYYKDMAQRKYIEALEDEDINVNEFPHLKEYVADMTQQIVEATIKPKDGKKDVYLTSEDRAMFIAENESNAVRNLVCLEEAIKKGYKKKMWVTKHDRRVRHTHVIADGTKIGILDYFQVGESEMAFPKDTSQGAEAKEIVGCRCVCKYFKK